MNKNFLMYASVAVLAVAYSPNSFSSEDNLLTPNPALNPGHTIVTNTNIIDGDLSRKIKRKRPEFEESTEKGTKRRRTDEEEFEPFAISSTSSSASSTSSSSPSSSSSSSSSASSSSIIKESDEGEDQDSSRPIKIKRPRSCISMDEEGSKRPKPSDTPDLVKASGPSADLLFTPTGREGLPLWRTLPPTPSVTSFFLKRIPGKLKQHIPENSFQPKECDDLAQQIIDTVESKGCLQNPSQTGPVIQSLAEAAYDKIKHMLNIYPTESQKYATLEEVKDFIVDIVAKTDFSLKIEQVYGIAWEKALILLCPPTNLASSAAPRINFNGAYSPSPYWGRPLPDNSSMNSGQSSSNSLVAPNPGNAGAYVSSDVGSESSPAGQSRLRAVPRNSSSRIASSPPLSGSAS